MRNSTLKRFALLIPCPLLLLIGGAWIWYRTQEAWRAFQIEVDSLHKRLNIPPQNSRSSSADLLPGSAWEDYGKANELIIALNQRELSVLNDLKSHNSSSTNGTTLASIPSASTILEHMTNGARRADSYFSDPEFRSSASHHVASFQDMAARLPQLVEYESEHLLSEGKAIESLKLMLDVATFGRDLAVRANRTDFHDGLRAIDEALSLIVDVLKHYTLKKNALLLLNQQLEVLDGSWPAFSAALNNDLLMIGVTLLEEDRTHETIIDFSSQPRIRRGISSVYSSRIWSLQTFRQAEAYIGEVERAFHSPAEQGDPIVMEVVRRRSNNKDPMFRLLLNLDYGNWSREIHTRLRLVRMIVHQLAREENLATEDPLGGKLTLSNKNGVMRAFRSSTLAEKSMFDLEVSVPSHFQD